MCPLVVRRTTAVADSDCDNLSLCRGCTVLYSLVGFEAD
jgi:hypothetical protein